MDLSCLPGGSHGLSLPGKRPHVPGAGGKSAQARPSPRVLALGSQGTPAPPSLLPLPSVFLSLSISPSPSLSLSSPSPPRHAPPLPRTLFIYSAHLHSERLSLTTPRPQIMGCFLQCCVDVKAHPSHTGRAQILEHGMGGRAQRAGSRLATGLSYVGSRKQGQGLGRGLFSRPAAPRPG